MSKTENTQENSQESKIVRVRNQLLQFEATNSSVFVDGLIFLTTLFIYTINNCYS